MPEVVREPSGRFRKGASPNPGGRPKGIHRLLDELFGDDVEAAYAYLAKVFADKKTAPGVRRAIAMFVIERRHGRAPQATLNLNVDADLKSLTDEELRERIAQLAGADPRLAGLLERQRVVQAPGGNGVPEGTRPADRAV